MERRLEKMKVKKISIGIFLGCVGVFLFQLIRLLSVSDLSETIPFFTNDTQLQYIYSTQLINTIPFVLIGIVIGFVGVTKGDNNGKVDNTVCN